MTLHKYVGCLLSMSNCYTNPHGSLKKITQHHNLISNDPYIKTPPQVFIFQEKAFSPSYGFGNIYIVRFGLPFSLLF